ncbi:MAG: hypothetical protein RL341_257 [Pseudomonadota bacterium]|jgi:hypothetical protein
MSTFKRATVALLIASAISVAGAAMAQQPVPTASTALAPDGAPRKYTFFIHLKTRDAWLQLSAQERLAYVGKNVFPILARHPAVKVRFYDAEFYTARLSDIMFVETTDLRQYERFIDALRDQEFWHKYFDVLDIVMTTENLMVDFTNARTTMPK